MRTFAANRIGEFATAILNIDRPHEIRHQFMMQCAALEQILGPGGRRVDRDLVVADAALQMYYEFLEIHHKNNAVRTASIPRKSVSTNATLFNVTYFLCAVNLCGANG